MTKCQNKHQTPSPSLTSAKGIRRFFGKGENRDGSSADPLCSPATQDSDAPSPLDDNDDRGDAGGNVGGDDDVGDANGGAGDGGGPGDGGGDGGAGDGGGDGAEGGDGAGGDVGAKGGDGAGGDAGGGAGDGDGDGGDGDNAGIGLLPPMSARIYLVILSQRQTNYWIPSMVITFMGTMAPTLEEVSQRITNGSDSGSE